MPASPAVPRKRRSRAEPGYPFSMRLGASQFEALSDLAQERKVSMGSLVREAIAQTYPPADPENDEGAGSR